MWWNAALVVFACAGEDARSADEPGAASVAVQDTPRIADGAGDGESVLFVGTSLTAGLGVQPEDAYPALVGARIDSAGLPYTVVNAGSSGETSAGALQRMDWLIQHRDFDVLVLETGANDGLRGLPIEGTMANIDAIIRKVGDARPDAKILLVQMEAPPNLGGAYTSAFRAMFSTLAARHGLTLVPFLLEGVAGVDSLNQADGIHPNEAGHRMLAATVWQALEPVLARREVLPPEIE